MRCRANRPPTGCLLVGGLLAISLSSVALAQPPAAPIVSIVIDDVGNNPREDRRAIALPGPIAIAILPHTPSNSWLAEQTRRAGKEVLLHLPMDPDSTDVEAGPGRIENHMSAPEIAAMLLFDLRTVPHAVGVNNHMGSRLTQNRVAMQALMRAMGKHGGLFFLDSRTSPHSIAARVAVEHGVPALERDIFLDHERGEDSVRHSIQRLERLLLARGHAVAIGHPYPETLAALERWLAGAGARGIRVVPLSVMLERRKASAHAERQ